MRGVALPYVLVVSLMVIMFVSAMLVRVTQTLRFTTYDEAHVQARHLADSAARLAVVLMRDHDSTWYRGRLPVSGQSLGFSEAEMGGTFEIQVYERSELGGDPFPPQGTYRTVVCTARAGNRTARTMATVKVTSPLLNYVSVVKGDLLIGYDLFGTRKITGPLLTLPNPSLGQRGDVRLFHAVQFYDHPSGEFSTQFGDVELAAEIKAAGRIVLQNLNEEAAPPWNAETARYVRDGVVLEGTVQPGSIGFTTPDINVVASGANAAWGGSFTLTDELKAESDHRFGARVHDMKQVLERLRRAGRMREVDVSGYPGGVLVEFQGRKAYVSQVGFRGVGRLFDHDLTVSHRSQLLAEEQNQNKAESIEGLKARLNREVQWNDPLFPDAAYPGGPRDLDGDGVRESVNGDCFQVRRVVRGARIGEVAVNRSDWTVIVFRSAVTYVDPMGNKLTPPLYLRGDVEGKVVVVHDVVDEAQDPGYDRVQTLILAEHEDPGDVPAGRKIGPAPGISGGLRIKDRRYKERPDSAGRLSKDHLVIISRGQVQGVGQPGFYLRRMRKGSTVYDYQADLRDLDREHASARGASASDADFQLVKDAVHMGANVVRTPVYGVLICNLGGPGIRHTAEAMPVMGASFTTYPYSGTPTRWMDIPGSPGVPPLATGEQVPILPRRMRNAYTSDGSGWRLYGALHGLRTAPGLLGEVRFDYRFQDLEAPEIEEQVGLPLSIVLTSWLRR